MTKTCSKCKREWNVSSITYKGSEYYICPDCESDNAYERRINGIKGKTENADKFKKVLLRNKNKWGYNL
jgi:hypothetical protein